MRRLLLVAATAALTYLFSITAFAQDNLLTNGGLEQGNFGPYSGRGRGDLTVPAGWDIWLGQGEIADGQFMNRGDKVFGFPHNGPGPDPVEGSTALNFSGGFVQFNVAIFQTVPVAQGTNVRAEAATQVKACTPPGGGPGFCGSDLASGARTRIGIDPNGGSDPNSAEIIWSAWLEPHDRWDRQAIDATATGAQVTVFIYATQGGPFANNQVWIDDAKLFVGGGGGAAPAAEGDSGSSAAAPPPPPPNVVPFVNPQGAREDGRIIHTVQQGDTLDSIAVAYGLTRNDLIERNPSLGSIRFLSIGQEIVIQQAPTPTPTTPAATTDSASRATPVPGGVVTEEVAPLPATQAATATESLDAVINPDPKGVEPTATPIPSEQDDSNVDASLDILGAIFGDADANAVPDDEMTTEAETEEAEATEEATTEATEEATAEATEAATTVADAAPVVEPESVPEIDVASSTVAVCVTLFEDINQNRLRENNESLLGDGVIVLNQDGAEVARYETNGQSEPYCFTDLAVGEYIAAIEAPAGYGLTTPNQLRLPLTAGTALNLEVGAAEGVEVAAVPPDDAAADLGDSANEVLPAEPATLADNLMAISGIIVAVLAGVVVLAGVGAAVLIRRAN